MRPWTGIVSWDTTARKLRHGWVGGRNRPRVGGMQVNQVGEGVVQLDL